MSKKVSVDFSKHLQLLERLKKHASKTFRSLNSLVLFIISDYFERIDNPPRGK